MLGTKRKQQEDITQEVLEEEEVIEKIPLVSQCIKKEGTNETYILSVLDKRRIRD